MDFIEGILYMIWRGVAVGVIVSAPMGPVGILCVQRTLEKGRRTGFFTGVGAAISDLFYCLLTGFGLSFIEEFLERNHDVIQLIGSVVLIAFGIYLFKSNPSRKLKKPGERDASPRRDIINGFLFTFSNPLIIFLIIGLFARFNFMMPNLSFGHYMVGFIFIFAGALMWWWLVTFFVDKVRAHFNLRSMWLINKIIGGIILIFAAVGIVTAVSGIANATERIPVPETLEVTSPPMKVGTGNCDNLTLFFRAANLNNEPRKKYPAILEDGTKTAVSHPAWALSIIGNSSIYRMEFRTIDTPTDETYTSPAFSIESYLDDNLIYETQLISDIDFYSGTNAFRASLDNGRFILSGGNRTYQPLASFEGIDRIDSISFSANPGGKLLIKDLWIETEPSTFCFEPNEYGNNDILDSYLLRSKDPIEGRWQVLDRMLDENHLRPGGDYLLAIISDGDGYDLIYLGGARKNKARWVPGTLKGRLSPTKIQNVFDVTWYDANGRLLDTEIHAQYGDHILSLSFPYLESTLRLVKIRR